jgi:hypothetical protein
MTAKFSKEKEHHITRQNEFGGLDREIGKTFPVTVHETPGGNLLNIIEEWILPGFTTQSDPWTAYNILADEEKRQ